MDYYYLVVAEFEHCKIFPETKINKEMYLKLIEYYDTLPLNKEQFIKNVKRYYGKGVSVHLFKENS